MCSKLNPICDVEHVIGSVGSHVAGSVFGEVAKAFGDAAAKVTGWMWTVIASTTTVDLSGGWFRSTLGLTATLAGVLILAIFVLELIKAALRRESGALTRAVLGVGGGLLGAAAAIGVVEALLAATDAVSDGIVRTAGLGSLATLGRKVAPAGAIAGVGEPALILILGLGYVMASFFVWALFIARKAMIIVAAVFAPVAFSGAAARATAGWVRQWVEFTVAMVFSKLVVVIIFTLALSLVGQPGKGMAAVGALFSGLAMMVLACFAPWMLFKLVHFVGGDVLAAHHRGLHQSVMAAGAAPAAMARTGAAKFSGIVSGIGGGDGPTAGSWAAGSQSAPAGLAKPLTNNPVIKTIGGMPPRGTGDGGPGGPPPPAGPPGPPPPPRPRGPDGPSSAAPPYDPQRPVGPSSIPQPAPSPTT